MAARIAAPRAARALNLRAPRGAACPTIGPASRPHTQFRSRLQQQQQRLFSASTASQVKKYTEDHEWVEFDSSGKIMTLGISSYAAQALGDVIYIELPEVDLEIGAGDAVGAVESVKSASDILSPLAGRVVEANTRLEDEPALLNKDPEGEAWICRIEPLEGSDGEGAEKMMDEAAYRRFTEEQEGKDE